MWGKRTQKCNHTRQEDKKKRPCKEEAKKLHAPTKKNPAQAMGENNNNNDANRLKIPHPLPSFYHFSYGPSLIWIVVVGRLGEKDGTG